MDDARVKTEFAPAERVTPEELKRQVATFGQRALLREVLDATPVAVMGLNSCRQIIYCNLPLLRVVGAKALRMSWDCAPVRHCIAFTLLKIPVVVEPHVFAASVAPCERFNPRCSGNTLLRSAPLPGAKMRWWKRWICGFGLRLCG